MATRPHRDRLLVSLLGVLALTSCGPPPRPASPPPAPRPPPAASAAPAPAAPAPAGRFTILQINDVYRIEGLERGALGGLARVRTLRKQLEQGGAQVLMLHGGDALFPSVMSKHFRARPMIEVLNQLDGAPDRFDDRLIVVPGNHEFDHPDPGVLLGRLAQSEFRWLATNIRTCSAPGHCQGRLWDRLRNVHETLVVNIGGVPVGLFSLTLDAQPRDWIAYEYGLEERRARVRQALAKLKAAGARMLVALTHQDVEDDEGLARDFPELDLIVGGHEHFALERQVGKTLITKAEADARSVYVLEVTLDGAAGSRPQVRPRRVALDASVVPDPDTDRLVNRWLTALGRVIREPMKAVAQTQHRLEGIEPAVRGRETALGNFLADTIRQRLATDIAFLNGGAIRLNDDLPPGPVRNYDLESLFYYDNQLVAFELSGAEILDLLRTSVAKIQAGHGRFLQVAGLRFRCHIEGPPGALRYRIEAADVHVQRRGRKGFEPLQLARRYRAGTIDYLWRTGFRDGYTLFSVGRGGTSPARVDRGKSVGFRQATLEAIRRLPDGRITSRVEGRIELLRAR